MKYQYYIQGIHAVRIGFEGEIPMKAARYDPIRKRFIPDFEMISCVVNDIDARKVSREECWEFIAPPRNIMKSYNSSTPSKISLPWHIYFDKKGDKKSERSGRLIHVEEPEYECRFHIGKSPIEAKGLVIHNVSNDVQLYDVKLPEGASLIRDFKKINVSMKEGAHFLYNILYLPYFRRQ